MNGWVALLGPAALGIASCSDQVPERGPIPDQGNSIAVPKSQVTHMAAPERGQVGVVSGLTATTSALKGQISTFQVQQTATETVATFAADALFAFDSATIAAGAADNLRRSADLVAQGGTGTIKVIGHTDGKGDDAYNDALSRKRAQAVADWLRGPGGLPDRTYAVEGRGKRDPVAPNTRPDGSDDPEGRTLNRRVVVVIPRA